MSVDLIDIKNKKNRLTEELSTKLEQQLQNEVSHLRGHQLNAIRKLIRSLKQGVTEGLFKHPTGAGKTFLFGEILRVAGVPSLVLVPRSNLIEGTRKDLVTNVGHKPEDLKPIDLEDNRTGRNASKILQNILSEPGFSESKRVIIMTYQSFLSIYNSNPKLIDQMFRDIKILICDEAHRSMGEKTTGALLGSRAATVRANTGELLNLPEISGAMQQELVSEEEDFSQEDAREVEAEDKALKVINDEPTDFLNLRFTATPTLSKKNVQSIYRIPVIDFVTIGELVEDGTLIMPEEINIGEAVYRTENTQRMTEAALTGIADKFKMKNGADVATTVLNAYKQKKESVGGYLPGVAFCKDITEANRFRMKLKEEGIRAICCTSGELDEFNKTPKEAESMVKNNEIDVIVTVSKVAEGWDVPTLRCAMVLTPMRSPARILQAIGRIMRSLRAGSGFPKKDRTNTCIIQPKWVVKIERRGAERVAGIGEAGRKSGGSNPPDQSIFESLSFTDTMYNSGELELGALGKLSTEVQFNPNNDDMLRALIGSVDRIIKNGRGIDISKEGFTNETYHWNINGRTLVNELDYSRDKEQKPWTFSESLALRLWPDEAKNKIFDPKNDDHLRMLIGGPEYLIYKGKGLENWTTKEFRSTERGWSRVGREIPVDGRDIKERGPEQALELAQRLWPEETRLQTSGIKNISSAETGPLGEEVLKEMRSVFEFDQYGFVSEPRVEMRNRQSDSALEFGGHVFKYSLNGIKKQITGLELLRTLRLLDPGENIPADFIKRIYKKLWPNGFDQ